MNPAQASQTSPSVSSKTFPESFDTASFPDAFLIVSVVERIEICKSGDMDPCDVLPESTANF